MPLDVQATQVDVLLKMAAALKRPPMVVHHDDPMNTGLICLTQLLFDKKGILGKNLKAVQEHSSMERLYAAIRAAATLPSGGVRGNLNNVFPHLALEDIRALSDTLLELIKVEAPADAMFAEGIRTGTAKMLLARRIDEAVGLSLELYEVGGAWTRVELVRAWGGLGPSIKTHKLWPQVEAAIKGYRDEKFPTESEKAMAAINNPKSKTDKFVPLLR